MSNLVPFTMLSAVAVLDSSLSGWTLLDIPASGRRAHRYQVVFERAFKSAPLVHVGLVGIDASKEDNVRIRIRPLDISSKGFTIQAETWFNTKIWSVDVAWLAIGA